ncbi:hypothetical protein PM082_021338 [Marasmius tenuissimus]|nr:hypothetical protein PM082_021338 [Marasmius tenuissimus]
MDLENRFRSYFYIRPPTKIDFDDLDPEAKNVFTSLEKITDALLDRIDTGTASTTVRQLDRYWACVWHWIRAFSRSLIDGPLPITPEGVANARYFTCVVSLLVVYPTCSSTFRGTLRGELKPIINSTPEILALMTELWLYAREAEPGKTAESLLHACNLFLETCIQEAPSNVRRLQGKVFEKLEAVLKPRHLELPLAFVSALVSEASRPGETKILTIQETLTYINILVSSKLLTLQDLHARDAIRWATILFHRVVTSSDFQPGGEDSRHMHPAYAKERIQCVLEYMSLFHNFFARDVFYSIPALDEGILISVWRAKSLVIEDSKTGRTTTPSSITFHFSFLFKALTANSLHRSILVRVIRSLKKIKDMGLDRLEDGDNSGICKHFKKWWSVIQSEVTKRQRFGYLSSSCEPSLINQICHNKECPRAPTGKRRIPLLRCSACLSAVYCSKGCQRDDWKSRHESFCREFQRNIRAGSFPRVPSQFEKTFMQFQVGLDLRLPSLEAQAVQEITKYQKQHPDRNRQPIIWIDYMVVPPKVTVKSPEESSRLLDNVVKHHFHEHAMHVKAIGYDYGGCSVIAQVFWRGVRESPLYVGLVS